MPDTELERGQPMQHMGAALLGSGALVVLAALITMNALARGFTVVLFVLAGVLWINGGMLWWCGTKAQPARIEPVRDDRESA